MPYPLKLKKEIRMKPQKRNKKRRGSFDPSKTTTLRQAFMRSMARRILALKRGIRKWLVEEDELGLVPRKPFKLSIHKRTFSVHIFAGQDISLSPVVPETGE